MKWHSCFSKRWKEDWCSPGSLQQAQVSASLEESDHCHRPPGVQHWALLPNAPFWGLLAPLALCPPSWEEAENQDQSQPCPHGWAYLKRKKINKIRSMPERSPDAEIPMQNTEGYWLRSVKKKTAKIHLIHCICCLIMFISFSSRVPL